MKIIVTGGAGFIGSAVVRRLIALDFQVVNLDSLTYASCLSNIASVADDPKYSFVHTDINDSSALKRIFTKEQPHAVMHLAAESHVDRSIDSPGNFINTNINGTYTLLEATRSYWNTIDRSESFRFIHISTDEVYGSLGPTGKFTEDSPYSPNSPYSASKAASDHLVRAWQETYRIPAIITNCSNNYGPYQFPEKLIPVVILNAMAGKPIPVYGKGENIRDWLYVEDHVDALIAATRRGKVGRTYNIGGENEVRNIDLVHMICTILDDKQPKNTHYAEQIEFVTDRPGHDLRYAIDATRIREELSWQPSVSLKTGLAKTVQWYLDNQKWWEGLQSRKILGERIGTNI